MPLTAQSEDEFRNDLQIPLFLFKHNLYFISLKEVFYNYFHYAQRVYRVKDAFTRDR